MNPKKLWIPLLALVAIGAAAGYWKRPRYEQLRPARGELREAVYGLGKVRSDRRFEVIAGVISTVTRRHVKEGDFVRKGAPLLELDSQAVFRAPFDGTVTFVSINEGSTALPQVPQLRLEDLSSRYIELSLEQESALRVRPGQSAKISVESLRGSSVEGKVTAIFPRENEFVARIAVENLDRNVLPGMSADVAVEIGLIPSALLIPLRAVQNGMVSVLREGSWKKIKLEIGHVDGENAEVIGGAIGTDDLIRLPERKAGGL